MAHLTGYEMISQPSKSRHTRQAQSCKGAKKLAKIGDLAHSTAIFARRQGEFCAHSAGFGYVEGGLSLICLWLQDDHGQQIGIYAASRAPISWPK